MEKADVQIYEREGQRYIDVDRCLTIHISPDLEWAVELRDPEALRLRHLQAGAEATHFWFPELEKLGPLACENTLRDELSLPMQRLPLDWEASKLRLIRDDDWEVRIGYSAALNRYYVVGELRNLAHSRVEEGMTIAPDEGRVVVWSSYEREGERTERRWEAEPGRDWTFFQDGQVGGMERLPHWVATQQPQRTAGEYLVHETERLHKEGTPLLQAFAACAREWDYRIQPHGHGLAAWEGDQPLAYCDPYEIRRLAAVDVPETWAFPREKLERLSAPRWEIQL